MSKEKQIDEMARTMCFQRESCTAKSCTRVNCEKTWLAERLYNAGYRRSSDVAREMCRMLREDLRGFVDADYLERLLTIYEKKYTEGCDG